VEEVTVIQKKTVGIAMRISEEGGRDKVKSGRRIEG